LVDDVLAAGGRLIVQRQHDDRDSYYFEQLIATAHRFAKVPAGKRLASRTLPWPDIEIRLVDAPPGTDMELRPVPVADTVSCYHPVVVRFRETRNRHEVSQQLLPRLLRILHALVTEADRRGYHVANMTDGTSGHSHSDWTGSLDGHVTITINGHACALRLREPGLPSRAHWDRTHYQSRERYPDHGSGTLAIEICDYSSRAGRPYRWSDRRSWSLEDKLAGRTGEGRPSMTVGGGGPVGRSQAHRVRPR